MSPSSWLPALAALFLCLAPLPAGAACDAVEPLDLRPADLACPGWTRDGDPLSAHTVEELSDIINGGAFLYAGYGFVAAAFQNYTGEVGGEPAAVTLAVFNQGNEANAAALYQDPASGEGDAVPDWPGTGEARARAAFGAVTFQFHEACFFVSLVVTPADETALPDARCLAEATWELIDAATASECATWGAIKNLFE